MNLGTMLSSVPAAFLALPCLTGSALAELPGSPSPAGLARVPNEPHLVVKLLPDVPVEPLATALGSEVVVTDLRRGLHLLTAPSGVSAEGLEALATSLKGFPTVLYAEVDEPTDPPEIEGCAPGGSTGIQQCTIAFIDGAPGASAYFNQPADFMLQAGDAQALGQGVPVLVAVVDTGVDMDHPLLAGHLEQGYDYINGVAGGVDAGDGLDNDGDGLIDEGIGHGSHVAGLILLADPNARILPLRALDSDGNGSAFLVALAIEDAVDAGAAVINLSLSTRNPCNVIAEALMYAEYHGTTVVVSAGNAGAAPLFPASYHASEYASLTPTWLPAGTVLTGANVVSVATVDEHLVKPAFSCFGADVDLSAPGKASYSAFIDSQFAWWSGTSMSAGFASGSYSFVLSLWDEDVSYAGTPLQLLQETASDALYSANPPGFAGKLGAGLIQLKAAVIQLLGLPPQ
jgi:subtilisin family serine protease